MERKHVLRIVVVLAVAAVMASPTPSTAVGRTSFHAETPPLPQPTLVGGWTSSGGRSARLQFEGVHAVGDHTSFDARWTSSWTRTLSPFIEADIQFESLDPIGEQVAIGYLVRHQVEGGEWSRWTGDTRVLESDQGPSIYGGFHPEGLVLSRSDRLRFQVKILGRLDGPATLTGRVEVTLKTST